MISIVMPLNATSFYDVGNCFFALQSFIQFFPLSSLAEWIIVCKKSRIPWLRFLYRDYLGPLKIRFISEEEMLSCSFHSKQGYFAQQLIKFAVARWIQTDFYLTCDNDVLCCRPFSLDEFIRDGKLTYGNHLREQAVAVQTGAENEHNRVFQKDSRALLGNVPEGTGLYGVTPQFYSRKVSLDMQSEIAAIGKKPWDEFLLSLTRKVMWSEQGLYFGYIQKHGLESRYYHFDSERPLNAVRNSAWTPEDLADENSLRQKLADAFRSGSPGAFIVMQSYMRMPLFRKAELLKPYVRIRSLIGRCYLMIHACLYGLKKQS